MEDNEKYIETVMKEINQIDTKIKLISFGKTKPKTKKVVAHTTKKKTQDVKESELK